jgi:hypothetical protein
MRARGSGPRHTITTFGVTARSDGGRLITEHEEAEGDSGEELYVGGSARRPRAGDRSGPPRVCCRRRRLGASPAVSGGPIIDRVTGVGQYAPLAGSSVTGLVSDSAGREEM